MKYKTKNKKNKDCRYGKYVILNKDEIKGINK